MSQGLFRNFEKIIPAAKLATKNHNFLFRSRFSNTCPTGLYFNPDQKTLPKGHSENPFSLALSVYGLLRQNLNNQSVLRQIEQNPSLNEKASLQRVRSVVEQTVRDTQTTIEDYYQQLHLLVSSGKFNLPVQTCVEFIYITEHLNKADRSLYSTVLVPVIKSKADFLSLQNIIDLIVSLEKANYLQDKALLKTLLDALNRKQLPSQFRRVDLSGWRVDRFEDVAENSCNYNNEMQRYYDEVNRGAPLAEYRHLFRTTVGGLWNSAVNRLLLREWRIRHKFDCSSQAEDLKNLVQVLERLDKSAPELKAAESISFLKKNL